MKVLLIDRDCLFQKAFQKMLEDHSGCELIGTASDPEKSMDLCGRYHPDIVFADAKLGEHNGIAICSKIRRFFPETACYIVSNRCNVEYLQKAIKAGISEYIMKPLSREKLMKVLEDNSKIEKKEDNLFYEKLASSIEERDYKKSYDVAKELVDCLFRMYEWKERKDRLNSIKRQLFYMISGLDTTQKDYYIQKFDVTSKEVNKKLLCYCWLMEVVTEVYRQLCTMKYSHMSRAFRYIEMNKTSEISLADLSDEAGISSGYLSRIFRKYYKNSVVDYIHLRKLLMAKQYMATSEMNISDISYLLGYSEAGYFCKIFKKYEGQTPSSFQKDYTDSAKAAV